MDLSVSSQDLQEKEDARQLAREWFYKMIPNGEKMLQSWRNYWLFSEELNCFCRRFFAVNATETHQNVWLCFRCGGNWARKYIIMRHPKNAHIGLKHGKHLPQGLGCTKQLTPKVSLWWTSKSKGGKTSLHRLLDIKLFLAKHILAFRGNKEDESPLNKGNFL